MKLLEKIFSKTEPTAPKPRWDVPSVSALLRHYPVGSRVLYFPESKKELRLESVILGCTINRRFVFSQGQIRFQGDANGGSLAINDDEGDALLREIQSFYLLIPYQTRSEIDYQAEDQLDAKSHLFQKDVNDFGKGSLVTLICYSPYGRVPHIETAVKTVSVLTKGFYANHKVVVLDPFFNTLTEVDQRRHHRVTTRIALALRTSGDSAPVNCVMEDFSERFVRVRLGEGEPLADQLAIGRRLALTLDPTNRGVPFTLQGCVHRKNRGAVVIELKAILKHGRFTEFQLVDQLAFKAALLDHPATQDALRKSKLIA